MDKQSKHQSNNCVASLALPKVEGGACVPLCPLCVEFDNRLLFESVAEAVVVPPLDPAMDGE